MRWIDIILPEPKMHQEFDLRLGRAAELAVKIPALQDQFGLDSIRVLETMTKVGQELFQGIVAVDPEAFSSASKSEACELPALDRPEYDELVGYHIVSSAAGVGLPWTWLHNGVGFIFAKHPLCVATHESRLPTDSSQRPWMQRLARAQSLTDNTRLPEILFVPGHTDRERRKLIYREAELIEGAIEHGCRGKTLLHLNLPVEPITPSDLVRKGPQFQAIHFAGPTSQPARSSDPHGEYWMNRLIEETTLPDAHELEDALGMEGEVLGVDPVTSLLDDIVARYETAGPIPDMVSASRTGADDLVMESSATGGAGFTSTGVAGAPAPVRSWLLDDGPINPENMQLGGTLPPLVFSNSYQALPALGQRFIRAGASTFIGPVVPLFSRPARIFAGHCYGAMGQGWCAAAALWKAAQTCRQELGPEHPAWLSYGIQGYGQLAPQYL